MQQYFTTFVLKDAVLFETGIGLKMDFVDSEGFSVINFERTGRFVHSISPYAGFNAISGAAGSTIIHKVAHKGERMCL